MALDAAPASLPRPRTGEAPVLALAGVEKSFPGVQALRGVSFDVAPAEVHALLGENGAGKSTLIKIISGVYQADAGTIRLDGKPVRFLGPHEARRAGIATIYQELLLFPELTVAENVFMGHAPRTRLGALDWPAMRAGTTALLEQLDIRDLDPAQVVGTLSVGNRQRVEILRALSQDARILIMDEPTAALSRARCRAAVRDRAAPAGARRCHRLYQPSAGGGLPARRSRHGAARRRACGDQAGHGDGQCRPDPDDGRPPDRTAVSEGRGAARRAGAGTARPRAAAGDERRVA